MFVTRSSRAASRCVSPSDRGRRCSRPPGLPTPSTTGAAGPLWMGSKRCTLRSKLSILVFRRFSYSLGEVPNTRNRERGSRSLCTQKKAVLSKDCREELRVDKKLKPFLLNNNLLGIDRIVPIGQALEIDIVWDGYEVINSLSRVISLK